MLRPMITAPQRAVSVSSSVLFCVKSCVFEQRHGRVDKIGASKIPLARIELNIQEPCQLIDYAFAAVTANKSNCGSY